MDLQILTPASGDCNLQGALVTEARASNSVFGCHERDICYVEDDDAEWSLTKLPKKKGSMVQPVTCDLGLKLAGYVHEAVKALGQVSWDGDLGRGLRMKCV